MNVGTHTHIYIHASCERKTHKIGNEVLKLAMFGLFGTCIFWWFSVYIFEHKYIIETSYEILEFCFFRAAIFSKNEKLFSVFCLRCWTVRRVALQHVQRYEAHKQMSKCIAYSHTHTYTHEFQVVSYLKCVPVRYDTFECICAKFDSYYIYSHAYLYSYKYEAYMHKHIPCKIFFVCYTSKGIKDKLS